MATLIGENSLLRPASVPALAVNAAANVPAVLEILLTLIGRTFSMSANENQYALLLGKVQSEPNIWTMVGCPCACVSCNSCTCACSCRVSTQAGEIEW